MPTPRKPAPTLLPGKRGPAARPTPPRSRAPQAVLFAGLLLLLAVVPYLGSLQGGFVSDDVPQIRDNGIVRDPGRWSEAFTSDVWAFKGESERPWSTYWRPLFVLWLAFQYQAFGAASALPWHLVAVALHAAVTLLSWRVALRLGLSPATAGAVAAIFAVHPAHVESVAWISGAPDPLGAIFALLAILAFEHNASGRNPATTAALSITAYALALLCKESFAGLPIFLAVLTWTSLPELEAKDRVRRSLLSVLPHLVLLGLYLLARRAVLGSLVSGRDWEPLTLLQWIGTVPRVLAFYAGHALVPFRLGPIYPLHAENPSIGTALALVVIATAALLVRTAKKQRSVALGCTLFLALLAPVLHLGALDPIELVHDRYLYLPLFGLWMAVLGGLAHWLKTFRHGRWRKPAAVLLAFGVLSMALRSAVLARVWHSELSLWNRGIETAPRSPTAWSRLGFARLESGDAAGAAAAFERALPLRPDAHSLTGRAQARLALGDRAGAAADLVEVLSQQPAFTQAAEQLASILVASGRLQEAETLLARTLPLAPWRRCSLTTNLAVVHYLQGRKDEALAELESVDGLLRGEPTTTCLGSLFHRSALLDELGRSAEARAADSHFLAITTGTTDPALLRLRSAARERVAEPR
ncbi:MAG: tetratricopeptide repeat protein [Thermoanaerobaculia bacterium]